MLQVKSPCELTGAMNVLLRWPEVAEMALWYLHDFGTRRRGYYPHSGLVLSLDHLGRHPEPPPGISVTELPGAAAAAAGVDYTGTDNDDDADAVGLYGLASPGAHYSRERGLLSAGDRPTTADDDFTTLCYQFTTAHLRHTASATDTKHRSLGSNGARGVARCLWKTPSWPPGA